MRFGIHKFIKEKMENFCFFGAAGDNIPESYCSLNNFFLSRLSQVRSRHLDPPSVVKPLEESGLNVLREET